MHPNGYHKSEQAKSRCWSCSYPENLEPTEEHYAEARQLAADGWLSVSNKYRTVARMKIPSVKELLQSQFHGTWLEEEMRGLLQREERFWVRMRGEQRELSPQVFYAFKKIGGQSA